MYFPNVKKVVFILLGILIISGVLLLLDRKDMQTIFRKKPAPIKVDTTDFLNKALYHSLDTFFTNRSLESGFSGSVLISVKGVPVFEKCYGYCDYRNKNLMTDTNAFQLASVSKTFTATATLWCIEHGELALDDTITKFFPQLPYKGITVEQLLCHRSGLPNYLYFCSGKCDKGKYLNNQQVIDLMIKEKPAAYAKPDKKFEYCNTNYLLLASIIEKVTGERFPDFMRETFFEPLGMQHSFIYDVTDSSQRKIAISYNSKWEIQHDDCFDGVVGDKGLYSTVHDMFLWDKAFYDGKLLSQEMMQEAYKPRSFEKPGVRNYGYGWRLMQKPDSSWLVYHNGWWHGNNTVFYRNIQDTTSIIILSNRFNKYVYNVQPLWKIIYGIKPDTIGFTEE